MLGTGEHKYSKHASFQFVPDTFAKASDRKMLNMEESIETDVIIVGGGGCGLSLSSMLSDYGIDHHLFERRAGASKLPKAHYLNQRAMEALRQHDMVEEILEKGTPSRNFSQAVWRTSLGGSGPLDRRTLHKLNSFGGDDGSTTSQTYQ